MNRALREDDIMTLRNLAGYINELRDVFYTDHKDQIITPFRGIVYRGVTFPDVSTAQMQYKKG